MRLNKFPLWAALGLAACFLLPVCSSAVNEEASAQLTKGPGLPESLPCSEARCPGKRKAATLVPSFTKSTTAPAQPTTHSSTKPPTTPSRTTAHHTQLPPGNRTTAQTTHTTPGHHPTAHGNRTTAPAGGTTPHPPTTAPLPTELPFVPVGDYEAKNGSATCLRMQMGLQIQVQYTSKAKQQLWGTFTVQPNRTQASGTCSTEEEATLNLRFPGGSLVFTFQKNVTRKTFYLSRVQARLTYQFFQATETSFQADNASLREFETLLGHSYQCRNRTLALAGDFRLAALRERVQAFELRGGEFGDAEVCPEQKRPIILPIVVGVVLGLLIVIVVVAYAVGRWRTHHGYQTL